MNVQEVITSLAKRAQEASSVLSLSTHEQRNTALTYMADSLRKNADAILAANAIDVHAAKENKTAEPLIDRLMLNAQRIEEMSCALEELVNLHDPVGRKLEERTLYNGIQLSRVSVPLGVVAVIYEARPNVTADAAGICIKSGNACILRGGSMAAHSNNAITEVLAQAVEVAGLPKECIQCVEVTDRSATDVLLSLRGLIDVVIPRGGAGLIQHCVECAKIPVIETGTGNCHVYIHESADLDTAVRITENAKCRRFGVCNAAETLLIDASVADKYLPSLFEMLAKHDVLLHLDEQSLHLAQNMKNFSGSYVPATSDDWATEYLAPEIAIKCVSGPEEAISHINTFGTGHSEAIVAQNLEIEEKFLNEVDAAAVYVNASTAFTDGGQFGLGAEIGISTQKLHARGPFATDALTSHKYTLRGTGQVR